MKSNKNVSFKIQPEKSSCVIKDDTPIKKKKAKKVKKVQIHVNKAIEEVSPLNSFNINEPAEDDQDNDEITINELIKKVTTN